MNSVHCRAYAKINLGLDVVGKRADGYHEVRMIMQTIHLYDKLNIKNGYIVSKQTEIQAGFYECKEIGNGMAEFRVQTELSEIAYYRLVTKEGKAVFCEDRIKITDSFRYLSVLEDSFSELKIQFYGNREEFLFEGEFDVEKYVIKVNKN